MNKLITLVAFSLLLSGCGGGGDETLANDVAELTAQFAVLDLDQRSVSMRVAVDDLATNPAYRDRQVVFRRVKTGSSDSFVGVFELSQAQWTRIAGTAPWTGFDSTVVPAAAVSGNRPAFNLDYDLTSATVGRFTLKSGRLDLPTAAEWTAACGVSDGWSFGSNPSLAQFQAAAVVSETATGSGGPQPVGQREANPAGFYDMHGNVWEWTKPGTALRGGSWNDPAWSSRAEITSGSAQGIRSSIQHVLAGVRLVLVQVQ